MPITDFTNKSVASARILIDLDIGTQNAQWINIGAGIYEVNFNNTYAFADLGLPNWFSMQNISSVGSLQVDGTPQTLAASLLLLTASTETFYYDSATKTLYIHLLASDDPIFHTVIIGATFGYSFNSFTPIGSNTFYDGRLLGAPTISKSRDPLFFGRIQYQGGDVPLINADGEFDTFAEMNNVYGNEARVFFGFENLDISEYIRIFTGFIENIVISEVDTSITITDKRKQLTKPITYSCTNKNALDAIVEVITTAYTNITYNPTFFDIAKWEAATENAPVVTIDMQEPDSVINVIQDICTAIFGLFFVTPENLFSFKVINITEDLTAVIPAEDVMNQYRFNYDPSTVVSSVRVGYDKDWTASAGNPYTFYTDTSEESGVFLKYKTYNQKEFLTVLPDLASATEFAGTVLDYTKEVHAIFEIQTSFKYYYLEIGDMVSVDIKRTVATIFGVSVCEVISIRYNLEMLTMQIGLRKLTQAEQNYDYRITDDGEQRQVEQGPLRILETT